MGVKSDFRKFWALSSAIGRGVHSAKRCVRGSSIFRDIQAKPSIYALSV